MSNAGWTLAIDFGTTASAAAVVNGDGAKLVRFGDAGERLLSCVFVEDTGVLLTGTTAHNSAGADPSRFIRTPKRHVGRDDTVTVAGGDIPVARLVAAVLSAAVARASEAAGGNPPERVVLTHPARWAKASLAVLGAAAAEAGIGVDRLQLIPEPVAAGYGTGLPYSDGSTIAVYDLGGGTFDVAVLRRVDGRWSIAGRTGGIDPMGGTTFDSLLGAHLLEQVAASSPDDARRITTPTALGERRAARRWAEDVVRTKVQLTEASKATMYVPPLEEIELLVTRDELEELVRPSIEATVTELLRTVTEAGVDPATLAGVLLCGDASRMPIVARTVTERLPGIDVRFSEDPKGVVALGAAAAADSRPAPAAAATATTLPSPTPSPAPPPGPGPADPAPASTADPEPDTSTTAPFTVPTFPSSTEDQQPTVRAPTSPGGEAAASGVGGQPWQPSVTVDVLAVGRHMTDYGALGHSATHCDLVAAAPGTDVTPDRGADTGVRVRFNRFNPSAIPAELDDLDLGDRSDEFRALRIAGYNDEYHGFGFEVTDFVDTELWGRRALMVSGPDGTAIFHTGDEDISDRDQDRPAFAQIRGLPRAVRAQFIERLTQNGDPPPKRGTLGFGRSIWLPDGLTSRTAHIDSRQYGTIDGKPGTLAHVEVTERIGTDAFRGVDAVGESLCYQTLGLVDRKLGGTVADLGRWMPTLASKGAATRRGVRVADREGDAWVVGSKNAAGVAAVVDLGAGHRIEVSVAHLVKTGGFRSSGADPLSLCQPLLDAVNITA